jgi:hypothetical protein
VTDLARPRVTDAPIPCRLCGGAAVPLFEKTILRRRRAVYSQCGACGLTQTEEPTWLPEAYASPISEADTGVLARNLGARRLVATFLHLMGVHDETGLDYAGGYGLFVRLMRDAGFSFYWSDPFAANLFARGFEWNPDRGGPRVVTAFEVMEHWVRPLVEFRALAALGADWIVTSTELHPGARPSPDWHYLVPESGQHVAFYRADTLARLGREAGYPHVLAGPFYQVFARRPVPAARWHAALRLGAVLYPAVRRLRRSLTVADSERVRAGRP